MMFKSKIKKRLVTDFLDYVSKFIENEKLEDSIKKQINDSIKLGYELIDNNEWGITFEIVSENLSEHYVILDREGISLAKEVVKKYKLENSWIYSLQRIDSPGYIAESWRLIDSEQIAKNNPYTFYKPSKEITRQLKVGDTAKMTFEFDSTDNEHSSAERMWVLINEIKGDQFIGQLDNHPYYIHDLFVGDTVKFEHKHIIDHNLDLTEPNLVDKYIDRCFVSHRVLYDNVPVGYLYREEPESSEEKEYDDSGWRILSGEKTQEYMDNCENSSFVSLGAVLSRDDSIIKLLDFEIGSEFERKENGKFERIT